MQDSPTGTVKADLPDTSVPLPDHPLVTLKATGNWAALNLRDVWEYRELLYFLTWRDVKVRYKQTLLGVAWAILQPLLTMVIFTLFFGNIPGIKPDIPYPLFAYAGLLPWTFFSNSVTSSGNSLVGSANLITKVYFPRMIIPAAAVAAGLVDFAIGFVILIGLMAYYRFPVRGSILMLPAFLVLTTLLALGMGMWLSALNVKYRDIRFALPFLIQLMMFVSAVFYQPAFVSGRLRWALTLNPLAAVIGGYRSALFALPFDWTAISIALGIIIALLVYSAYSFRRMEKTFADIV